MKKLQKYLVDTLTLSSDTKMTLGKKRLSTTAVHSVQCTLRRIAYIETGGRRRAPYPLVGGGSRRRRN